MKDNIDLDNFKDDQFGDKEDQIPKVKEESLVSHDKSEGSIAYNELSVEETL